MIFVGLGLVAALAIFVRLDSDRTRTDGNLPASATSAQPASGGTQDPGRTSVQDPAPSDTRSAEPAPAKVADPSTFTVAGEPVAEVSIELADSGKPLPGAVVWYWRKRTAAGSGDELESWLRSSSIESHQSQAVRLEADVFWMVRVPDDEAGFRIAAQAPGLWGCATFAPGRNATVSVGLAPDSDLGVRVVDAGGAPLAGATVVLRQRRLAVFDLLTAVSGEPDGIAVLRHVDWVLRSQSVAREGLTVAVQGLFYPPVEKLVDWTTSPTEPMVLTVRPSGSLEVTLIDRSGAPVRVPFEVRIAFDDHGSSRAWSEGRFETLRTQDGSSVVFEHVELGHHIDVRVILAGLDNSQGGTGPGPSVAGERMQLRIPLRDDVAVLCGRLVDGEGKALEGTCVSARIEHGIGFADEDGWSLRTAADGRFWIVTSPLEEEIGRLLALYRGSGAEEGSSLVPFHIVPVPGTLPLAVARRNLSGAVLGGTTELGDFALSEVPVLAAGTVVDSRGRPVEAAAVQASQLQSAADPDTASAGVLRVFGSRSDSQGRFEIRGDGPIRTLRIEAVKAGFAGEAILVPAGELKARIVLEEAGAISGRVLLDPSLNAASILVHAQREADPSISGVPSNTPPLALEADGRFTLRDLRTGSWSVQVVYAVNGRKLGSVENVNVAAGTTARDARLNPLDLQGNGRVLELQLFDAGGETVGDARAQSRASAQAESEWTVCKREGNRLQFFFDGRPLDIVISAAGYMRTKLERVDGSRRVTLARATQLRVELEDPALAPPAPLYIGLRLWPNESVGSPDSGSSGVVYFDARGALTYQVNSAGEQRVELFVARPEQLDLAAVPLSQVSPATLKIAEGGSEQSFRIAVDRTELESALRTLRKE